MHWSARAAAFSTLGLGRVSVRVRVRVRVRVIGLGVGLGLGLGSGSGLGLGLGTAGLLDVDGARITPGFSRDTKWDPEKKARAEGSQSAGTMTGHSGATPLSAQAKAGGGVEDLKLGEGIGGPRGRRPVD